jgi:hypothetical protein
VPFTVDGAEVTGALRTAGLAVVGRPEHDHGVAARLGGGDDGQRLERRAGGHGHRALGLARRGGEESGHERDGDCDVGQQPDATLRQIAPRQVSALLG